MKHKTFSLLVIFTISSVISIFIYIFLSLPQMVTWDEAGYILEGYHIAQAVKHSNLESFYLLTKNQFYYPFFQSWYLGITTVPFGYSINSARLVSSLLFIPTVLLIWEIGKLTSLSLFKKVRHLAALLPVILVLTSPLILFYSSNALKEGIGLTLTLLTLWLYLLARSRLRWYLFFLSGFSAVLLTLTKYNYGVLVLIPLGLETLIWPLSSSGFRKKHFWIYNFFLTLPIVSGLTYWLSPPGRLSWFWTILQNNFQVNLYDTNLIGHLLYYPLEIAMGYSFSWIACLLLGIGFIKGITQIKSLPIRLACFLFLLNFFLAERHMSNNQARFIYTAVPAFFLVGSFGLIQLFSALKPLFAHLSSLWKGLVISLVLVLAVLMLKDLIFLPFMIKPTASHQFETAAFYEQDFQNINRYDFNRSNWPHVPPPPQTPTIDTVFEFILSHVNPRQPVTLVGQLSELSPGLFNYKLLTAPTSSPSNNRFQEYFVTMEILPNTRFDNKDYRNFGSQFASQVASTLADKNLIHVADRTFPYLGIRITILAKN